MFITRKTLELPGFSDPVGLALISDLHIGSAFVNEDAIRDDLDGAVENGDRVAINGDVFDAIVPKDVRRYQPETVDQRLWGRSDVLTAQLDLGVDLLAPYADIIDMIGIGNHEAAVEKYHAIALVPLLIEKLQARVSVENHVIRFGGYEGFLDYRWCRVDGDGKANNTRRLVVYYHHGSGGSAPVTKGMIDFNRKGAWVNADAIWLGHKHNRLVDTTVLRCSCPLDGDEPKWTQQVMVMTGAYMDRPGQTSADALKNGRKSNWAADAGLAPQAMGGARLLAYPHRKVGWKRLRVLQ